MKFIQILLLILGLIAFILAALFMWLWGGPCVAMTLWGVGIALLLVDVVLILLWPPGDE